MKKLLALTMVLVLATGFVALAQTPEEKIGLDVGISVLESDLTVRADYNLAYMEVPLTQTPSFTVGVKSPDLLFDIYGQAEVKFTNKSENFLSGWSLAEEETINVGIGKSLDLDPVKVRIEGLALIDKCNEDVDYEASLILQYSF